MPAPRKRTPRQLSRQERVYELSVVEWKTIRQIAAELNISQETVISDIRHEAEKRKEQDDANKAARKTVHLDKLDSIINMGIKSRDVAGTGAFAAVTKAMEMKAKIEGFEAPVKLDVATSELWDAIEDSQKD